MNEVKKLIYIADDDENIRSLILNFLQSDGYEVIAFPDGDSLLREFEKKKPDLIILDVMMPGTDGLSVCSIIRKKSDVPIIILTARDSEFDYVQGITIGGDDYLTKPFKPTMLLMRVRALLRRVSMDHASDRANDRAGNRASDRTSERANNHVEAAFGKKEEGEILKVGDLNFSEDQNQITCNGREIKLTRTELKMLTYMMRRPEKAYSRDELLNQIWGYDSEVETRVTDETMRRIRRKLSEAGSSVRIQTVWGYGYRLCLEKENS